MSVFYQKTLVNPRVIRYNNYVKKVLCDLCMYLRIRR